jgi:hypothetical protein
MKILNDIAICILNWIEIEFNLDLIELNSNTLIGIWIDFNKILTQQLN